ncbi:MAG: hypothetical protein V5B30_09805 [Candidatus Accumulibacter delftensis]
MTEERPENATTLDALLNRHFAGKVVRKDLTKLIKEGFVSFRVEQAAGHRWQFSSTPQLKPRRHFVLAKAQRMLLVARLNRRHCARPHWATQAS